MEDLFGRKPSRPAPSRFPDLNKPRPSTSTAKAPPIIPPKRKKPTQPQPLYGEPTFYQPAPPPVSSSIVYPTPPVFKQPPLPPVPQPPPKKQKEPKKKKEKEKKKKEKLIGEKTFDYDADAVKEYLFASEFASFPKSGLDRISEEYMDNPFLNSFLMYVIDQKTISKHHLTSFIDRVINDPDTMFDILLLKHIVLLIKVVFNATVIQYMKSQLVLEDLNPITDIPIFGFAMYQSAEKTDYLISSSKVVEEKLVGADKIQIDAMTALDVFFASCMEAALCYGHEFVSADFLAKSTFAFQPIGHGYTPTKELLTAYQYTQFYHIIIMQLGYIFDQSDLARVSVPLYNVLTSVLSATPDKCLIDFPLSKVDPPEDISRQLVLITHDLLRKVSSK